MIKQAFRRHKQNKHLLLLAKESKAIVFCSEHLFKGVGSYMALYVVDSSSKPYVSVCVCVFVCLCAVLPNFEIKVDVPKIVLQDEPFSGTVHAQ